MTRSYNHYPHVYSNFSIFPFFTKCRRFIVAFVSVFLLSCPTCWNFEISMTSLYPNTSSIQYMSEIQVSFVCFFPWHFCRLVLNFQFCFYAITNSSSVLFYLLRLLFDSILHFISFIFFFPHIKKCVSLHGVFVFLDPRPLGPRSPKYCMKKFMNKAYYLFKIKTLYLFNIFKNIFRKDK